MALQSLATPIDTVDYTCIAYFVAWSKMPWPRSEVLKTTASDTEIVQNDWPVPVQISVQISFHIVQS